MEKSNKKINDIIINVINKKNNTRCDKLCENSWGYQCHNPCNCKSAVSCNPFTGECFCMDGFIGKQCEQECKEGYYGRNCSMKCSCEKKNTEKCETSNGYCKCQPGTNFEFTAKLIFFHICCKCNNLLSYFVR